MLAPVVTVRDSVGYNAGGLQRWREAIGRSATEDTPQTGNFSWINTLSKFCTKPRREQVYHLPSPGPCGPEILPSIVPRRRRWYLGLRYTGVNAGPISGMASLGARQAWQAAGRGVEG